MFLSKQFDFRPKHFLDTTYRFENISVSQMIQIVSTYTFTCLSRCLDTVCRYVHTIMVTEYQ